MPFMMCNCFFEFLRREEIGVIKSFASQRWGPLMLTVYICMCGKNPRVSFGDQDCSYKRPPTSYIYLFSKGSWTATSRLSLVLKGSWTVYTWWTKPTWMMRRTHERKHSFRGFHLHIQQIEIHKQKRLQIELPPSNSRSIPTFETDNLEMLW